MSKKNLNFILIFIFSLNLLFLGYLATKCFDKNTVPNDQGINNSTQESISETTNVIDSLGEDNPIMLIGTIRKENIPQELELGEYWYWIYFDDPHLLVNNASGVPIYIDKIQVNPPKETDFYSIEEFVDKKVEIYGYQTWGYAESSVFQVVSLREL